MAKKNPRKKLSFMVNLPLDVKVPGYEHIEHYGGTTAYSYRQAVSFVVKRGKDKAIFEGNQLPSNFVNLVMGELDHFGGAGNYAVKTNPRRVFGVMQTPEDIQIGKRLDDKDRRIMRVYDLAYQLALEDNANITNPCVRMDYIDRARASLFGSY